MKLIVCVCAALCLSAARGLGLGSDSTPAYLVLGKRNGEIWRCLFVAPTTCELFHKGNSSVTQTLLHDEHLYAAHDDGTVLKCSWYGNELCRAIYRAGTYVNSLAVAGGYLFAGGDDRKLVRCRLTSPHTCETVSSFDRRITSLYDFDKYIYVGTDQYLSRCSKGIEVKCSQVTSTDGQWIKGISGTNSTVIVLEHFNGLWAYDLASDKFNSIKPDSYKRNHMSFFEGHFYLIHDWDVIEKCKWVENETASCSNFVKHKGTRSISFVYGARHLRQEHLHQEGCQSELDGVYKASAEYRGLMAVQVIDERLCDARGLPVDTRLAVDGRAVFALGADGRLLLSTEPRLTSPASLLAGLPAAGAGEMLVEDGVVARIVACSQHYPVDSELNRQVVDALRSKGYIGDIDLESCVDNRY